MAHLSQTGDQYTQYYWNLAASTAEAPNWIAKWFLYHKFRYRDGRNRTHVKGSEDKKHHDSKQGKHHKSRGHQSNEYASQDDYYQERSMTAGVLYLAVHIVRCSSESGC